MDRQAKAYAYGITTVALWSTSASAFKLSLRYLSPVELLFYGVLFSCLVLSIVLVLQGKGRQLARSGWRAWRSGLLFGLLNPFLYYLVLFEAYELLPAQQAQPLNYTWAITLSLLSVPLLGHALTRRDLLAVAISYLGVYIISTRGKVWSFTFDDPAGVALALGSTVIWSVYWSYNTRDERDPVVGLFINFICSLPFIAGYLACTEGFRPVAAAGVAGAAYIGCFEMGISFVLWLLALKHTSSAARIANLIFLSPFLSLLLIRFVVGESILLSSLIGLLCISCGLAVQSRQRRGG